MGKNLTFQEIVFNLQEYWHSKDCIIQQPLDVEIGAGTFHPATFFAHSKNNPLLLPMSNPVEDLKMVGSVKILTAGKNITSFRFLLNQPLRTLNRFIYKALKSSIFIYQNTIFDLSKMIGNPRHSEPGD